jgi:hypothetical protein
MVRRQPWGTVLVQGRARPREVRCLFCRETFPVWWRGPNGRRWSWRKLMARHVAKRHPMEMRCTR